jgi:hypothetical protein
MMAQRALKHGVFVTGGVIEEAEDGRLYNAMPIYAPDGTLVANYRKVHLSRVMGITSESDVLTPGNARRCAPSPLPRALPLCRPSPLIPGPRPPCARVQPGSAAAPTTAPGLGPPVACAFPLVAISPTTELGQESEGLFEALHPLAAWLLRRAAPTLPAGILTAHDEQNGNHACRLYSCARALLSRGGWRLVSARSVPPDFVRLPPRHPNGLQAESCAAGTHRVGAAGGGAQNTHHRLGSGHARGGVRDGRQTQREHSVPGRRLGLQTARHGAGCGVV